MSNSVITNITNLIAQEQFDWKESEIWKTAAETGILVMQELVDSGYCFGYQRDASTGKNVLMWGQVDRESNFVEISRFESEIEKEFGKICQKAMNVC